MNECCTFICECNSCTLSSLFMQSYYNGHANLPPLPILDNDPYIYITRTPIWMAHFRLPLLLSAYIRCVTHKTHHSSLLLHQHQHGTEKYSDQRCFADGRLRDIHVRRPAGDHHESKTHQQHYFVGGGTTKQRSQCNRDNVDRCRQHVDGCNAKVQPDQSDFDG